MLRRHRRSAGGASNASRWAAALATLSWEALATLAIQKNTGSPPALKVIGTGMLTSAVDAAAAEASFGAVIAAGIAVRGRTRRARGRAR